MTDVSSDRDVASSAGFTANTFLIGAQRCGTTNLAYLLDQHPDITVSDPKEPLYYTKNLGLGNRWYAQQFRRHDTTVLLDASTWYSVSTTAMYPQRRGPSDDPLCDVPARIHAACPDARFIYTIRDPVVRANSVYWMLRRENPDFRRFGSLGEALRTDPFICRGCDYLGQIENFLELFPRDRLLVLVFEEVVRDLPAAIRRCTDFLGVEPLDPSAIAGMSRQNESYRFAPWTERLEDTLVSLESFEHLRRGLRKLPIPRVRVALGRLLLRPIPQISDADREFVRDTFRERNRELREFLGNDLEYWSC